jgi:Rap1a immunity proteins
MRRLFLSLVALASFAAASAPAGAQSAFPRTGRWTMDGNLLYAICKPDAYVFDLPYCYGYLLAAIDTMLTLDRDFNACMPRVTTEQIRGVVVSTLRSRPEIRYLNAGPLVAQIYQDAWNCQIGVAAQEPTPQPTQPKSTDSPFKQQNRAPSQPERTVTAKWPRWLNLDQ